MERRFGRSVGSLQQVFEFIDGLCAGYEIDEGALFAVRMSVEELFTNMVKYNPGKPEDILVEWRIDGGEIVVSLTDFDSDPFDISKVEDVRVDRPIEERRPGGLGIHLVKKLVDRIDYEYADRRSKTTIVKKIG
jgi:serine/threonine-protein kinase RsbW